MPNWYRNLVTAGGAHVEVDGSRCRCRFTEVTDDAERDECWDLLVAAYPDFASYRELPDRRLPVGVSNPEAERPARSTVTRSTTAPRRTRRTT